MEQPPGSCDDLQPEDLSTSSISTVIDLTRKGEECVLSGAPLDALRGVKSPGWYQSTSTSSPGLTFSESGSSDVPLQSGEHAQPNNAFSHTTVTLSYVSRSRVFSTQDTLCGRSPLCGVPSISKLSLHPPCDSDGGLGGTGRSLNQHYPAQAEGPVDLCQSLSQAGPEDGGGACRARASREANGGVISDDGDVEKQVPNEEDLKRSRSWHNNRVFENGGGESQSSSVECCESSPETLTPAAVEDEDEDKGSPEVLLLMSKQQDLCSLSREYISPLEEPVSPFATSLDDADDVFILPQASSSPSGDNLYLETEEEDRWDSRRTEGAVQQSSGVSKLHHHRRKTELEPLIDLTDDICASDVLEDKAKTVTAHMNGNAKALHRTLKAKELPLRSSTATQLDAIVMNINSSRYTVSGCIRTSKNASASPSTAGDSKLVNPKRNDAAKRGGCVRTSVSLKTASQKAGSAVKRVKTNNSNTDSCKASTSDSELLSNSKTLHNSTPPKSPRLGVHKKSRAVHSPETNTTRSKRRRSSQSSPRSVLNKNSEKEPELLSQPDTSVEIHVTRCSSPPPPPLSKSPKKSPGKAKGKAAGGKTSPTAKMKGPRTPKRRRKKPKGGQSLSMFSPKEPEIKLKYVNYKEEKRELRVDSFSPFVHVERRQSLPSLCTVINYPEEVRTQHRKGQSQQAHSSDFISATVPSTSCLQLGRASTHSQHLRALVCCLCGQSANAMDLGDLHGPYYPEGYQPSTKAPAGSSGLKEDPEYSDSDSSSCSVRGRRRKHDAPPAPWSFRSGAKQKGLLESQRWAGSPAAKRARSDASSADMEDWYSPPVLPQEPCEYWLHEDCGIWSAGVFLVKGKVYGLEEAVKVAQETTCSACCDPGAMLGCFFKGCPNKYHYRCALESADCVLIEENFSMKCKKHKNKTFRGSPGSRWDDR